MAKKKQKIMIVRNVLMIEGRLSAYLLCSIGRPNLQNVPETLLPGARLQAFSKLFLDLVSFFQSEVV